MKKKILLGLLAVVVVAGGVAGLSAYEAHIINVTAHIENALKVLAPVGGLNFGTVFPQEHLEKTISITTSESFCEEDQTRVLTIDYKIVQKPKCECDLWDPQYPELCPEGQYASVSYTEPHVCPTGYIKMTSLCPYLSKTPKQIDKEPFLDYGVGPFHDPDDLSSIATGTIDKDHDVNDDWIIDLAVPCFEGYCAQDWDEFVESHNPDADPDDYVLTGDPDGTDLGCDLWIEVTDIYTAIPIY